MSSSGDITLQLVAAVLSSGAISAAVSVGLFVGTTRTRLNKLEKDLDSLKKDLKEYMQTSLNATKNELDGKTKVLEERISGYKEKLDKQGNEVSDLTKLFRDVGFKMLPRTVEKGDKNG